jgi:hypothetical protein
MEPRESREGRLWSRVGKNAVFGAGVGVVIGAAIGALLGAFAFERAVATLVAAGVGALSIALVGMFAGILAGLESPAPGQAFLCRSACRRRAGIGFGATSPRAVEPFVFSCWARWADLHQRRLTRTIAGRFRLGSGRQLQLSTVREG